jgi:hypothetical protein
MSLCRVLAGLAVISCAATGLSLAATPASAAPAPGAGCAKVFVLAIPGTWDNGPRNGAGVPGMLARATAGLGAGTQVLPVKYSQSFFPWDNGGKVYPNSKAQAVDVAQRLGEQALSRCPGSKVALIGYSQGADAAGDLAARIGTGGARIRPQQVAGVVLVSDPRRSRTDHLIGSPLGGEGVGGPRPGGFGWVSNRINTICDPNDMYCNTPPNYYVTKIAGALAEGGQNPGLAAGVLNQMVVQGGIGNVTNELSDAKARQQIMEYNAFIEGGAHTDYGAYQVRPGVSALAWAHDYLAGLG